VWEELAHVTNEENDELCKPFSENEIKEALFLMGKTRLLALIKYPLNFINHVGKLLRMISCSSLLIFTMINSI
jgi:hypothetical protein